jgi:hypothetical protein
MERTGQELEEEELLQREASRLLNAETLQRAKQREEALRNVREAKEANSQLIAWKARDSEIARLEAAKIEADKLRRDDEFEAREVAEQRRKELRQADINRLIERQQQTLSQLTTQREDFDDRQVSLQTEKDMQAINALKAKNERMLRERREDYLEAKTKLANKGKRKTAPYATFPPDADAQREEDAVTLRDTQRARAVQDLAEFQRKQAQEKKEREDAERERTKLEFRTHVDQESQRTVEAQEYAQNMLVQAKSAKYRK